ncbi:GGDEF domain-containing protein [Marinomonas balearica]|uniref:diguanylate cyclase n=1 Tax=Marinomonas balearica TaxID=491947 RepID=A0A4R6MBB3_9GAMM|nr:GGDEF domain-containing protein [Marinomonas balearica]TDO98887.1 diguanylate cyclase (GGDEF)-like protein [Marinomonas balearica]
MSALSLYALFTGRKPPSVKYKYYRKYFIIYAASMSSFAVHTVFICFFYVINIPILSVINVFSVSVWALALRENYYGRHSNAIFLACAEISIHAVLATAYLGWSSGFQFYLWPAACLATINPRLGVRLSSAIGFGCIVLFILLKTVVDDGLYNFDFRKYADFFYVFNGIIAGISLIFGICSIRVINERQEEKLTDLATKDELTNLFNRRYINSYLSEYEPDADLENRPYCIVLGDLDYFKKVNDTLGHYAGDDVLIDVSRYLKQRFRSSDVVCRWGGEEFLFLLKDTSLRQAHDLVEKICRDIPDNIHVCSSQRIRITMSFGIAASTGVSQHEQLIKVADENLYQAKKQGRNCVVSSEITG